MTSSPTFTHPKNTMALVLGFLLLFISSSALACDRCLHQSKAAYFSSSSVLSAGACGYGSMALGMYGGHVAAATSALYRNGMGCGGCFQMRCKNRKLCSDKGVQVILTDLNKSNNTELVVSSIAFMGMARKGMVEEVKKLGIVDIEYKRIPCEYKKQNMAVRVEEGSQNPHYLAIKFVFQGGQTDIHAVEVAKVGTSGWHDMNRNHGVIWDTDRVPTGPLMFRMVITGGFDGKWIWARNVLPANWKAGVVYDTGVQITDIAQEGCSSCEEGQW